MKSQKPFLLLAVLYSSWIYAQQVPSLYISYPSVGAYSKNFSDPFSFIQNQAALSTTKYPCLGLYTERKFMLKELNFFSAVFSIPSSYGGFGGVIEHFGSISYSQSSFALAYGKTLSGSISIGTQFSYLVENIHGYEKIHSINAALGWRIYLTDKLQAGFQLSTHGGLLATGGLLMKYSSGLGYDLSKQCSINAEISKKQGEELDTKLMIHYAFIKEFFIRAGTSTAYNNLFFTIGLTWKTSSAGISLVYHPQLGFTPSLSILFVFNKKEEPR